MLSYKHIYHAGCISDVHKHSCLAVILKYFKTEQIGQKINYMETHAGSALYNLNSAEAKKTGEAEIGILRMLNEEWLAKDHIYRKILKEIKSKYGDDSYPGSPLIAMELLEPSDSGGFCELHSNEFKLLRKNLKAKNVRVEFGDGYELVLRDIRKRSEAQNIILIDPSYEIKDEYDSLPRYVSKFIESDPAAIIIVWYPMLPSLRFSKMIKELDSFDMQHARNFCFEFNKARQERGLFGTGLFCLNLPSNLAIELDSLTQVIAGNC